MAIATKWEIVGAKFVNREGELVQANDRLLRAIRGGAASFHSTSGVSLFKSSDLENTVTTVSTAYNNLAKDGFPSNLCMLPVITPFPNAGVVFTLSCIKDGPASDESRSWAAKISAFSPRPPGPPIQTTTMLNILRNLIRMTRRHVGGICHSFSVTHLSSQVIALLARLRQRRSLRRATVASHCISCGPIARPVPSLCPLQSPSTASRTRISNILGIVDVAGLDQVQQDRVSWAEEARNELAKVDATVSFTYLPFTRPDHPKLEGNYGENLECMRQIRREQNPSNVFSNRLVRL